MMSPSDKLNHFSRRQLLGGLALPCTTTPAVFMAGILAPTSVTVTPQTLHWDDGLQVQLSGDAIFRLEEGVGERRLQLLQGEAVILSAAPAGLHGALQPRLVVTTANTEVMPLGSRCVVACRSGGSTVTVLEGAIQVRQGGVGPTRTVRAGDRWQAS